MHRLANEIDDLENDEKSGHLTDAKGTKLAGDRILWRNNARDAAKVTSIISSRFRIRDAWAFPAGEGCAEGRKLQRWKLQR